MRKYRKKNNFFKENKDFIKRKKYNNKLKNIIKNKIIEDERIEK